MASLDGEGLEESDADADDAHGHAAANQQEEANAEAQADLGHDEAAVGGVEAVDGVVPSHRRQRGQDEGHHPDAHHRVHRLLLGVAQPAEESTGTLKQLVASSSCSMGFKAKSRSALFLETGVFYERTDSSNEIKESHCDGHWRDPVNQTIKRQSCIMGCTAARTHRAEGRKDQCFADGSRLFFTFTGLFVI